MSLIPSRKIFLVDGSSVTYRSFYGYKKFQTSNLFPTGAIYGINNFIRRLYEFENVGYICFTFDSKSSANQRKQIFKEYKGNRPKCPDDLISQFPIIYHLLDAWNIHVIKATECEADDILGTLARKFATVGFHVYIMTGDKDLYQLLNEHISIINLNKNYKLYTHKIFESEFGIKPQQLIDILSLAGDSADNIPGIKGIGEVSAMKLVRQFDSIKGIYENLDKITPAHIQKKLRDNQSIATQLRQIVAIDTQRPLDIQLDDLQRKMPNYEKLKIIYKQLEFKKELEYLHEKIN